MFWQQRLRAWLIVTLAIPLQAGLRMVAAEPASPASAPADEPTRLVEQLGDTSFSIRRAAAWRLREIGAPALPALREAADSPDPEVQKAVSAAIKAIDRPPLPEIGDGPFHTDTISSGGKWFAADFHQGQRVVRVEGDVRDLGQAYRRLKLTFTGPVNGKLSTQVYEASNEEELKWNFPQAWIFFHGIFNNENDMAAVRVLHNLLAAAVHEAMDVKHFSPDQRKQVEDRLQHYADVSSRSLAALMYDPDSASRLLGEELRESDAMRKFFAEMKLDSVVDSPDLFPPSDERLGIHYLDGGDALRPGDPGGLRVTLVAAGERADRIGVRENDVILSVNDVAIDSPANLRPACRVQPRGATMVVRRNGQRLTLHEPK